MRVWFISLLALACVLPWLITVNPAHAQSIPSRTITIMQHSNGGLYFSPAHPTCVPQTWVTVKIINGTRSTIGLLEDGRVLANDNPPILHAGHNTVNAINTVASPGIRFSVTQAKHKASVILGVC